jgi:hypothetical protein
MFPGPLKPKTDAHQEQQPGNGHDEQFVIFKAGFLVGFNHTERIGLGKTKKRKQKEAG